MTRTSCLIVIVFFALSCSKKILESQNKISISDNIKNIEIMGPDGGLGPCEPSIEISPINTDIIVAGSVLDNFHYSSDGGLTWRHSKLKSIYGVFGDPVLTIDKKGKIYFAHLSNPKGKAYSSEEFLDRIVVQTSDDGINFNEGTYSEGNRLKDHDKHWLYVNPIDNTILMSWTEFDKYGSNNANDKSRILFSKSKDQGRTWTDAIPISEYEGDCIDDDNTTEGAVPCVGIDGAYYVVWSYNEKIYLDKSTDEGKTWLKKDLVVAEQPGGWSFDIPGISRCNGMPVMQIDHSGGKNNGNIYISWSDQRNGKTDTDVWLIVSKDNGKTWSNPIRVNNDQPGKHQFFSWMDLDQSTGNLYWVFYDRRAYEDEQTDVYLAYSSDGGITIDNKLISESPFIPNSKEFFGDYNDISAVNGRVRPIWTRLHKGRKSIYTAIIESK